MVPTGGPGSVRDTTQSPEAWKVGEEATPLPGETLDSLLRGRLKILQHREGYRFSIDPLLLAHFFPLNRLFRVADLGTGCGVIALLLALRAPRLRITGYEVQGALCRLARRNAALNGFADRITIEEIDIRKLPHLSPPRFDGVVMNPPYLPRAGGLVNRQAERAIARHEIRATLEDFLRAAEILLQGRGRLGIVYPASRTSELLTRLQHHRFAPKRLRFVHPHPGNPARLILVEARYHGKPSVEILPPLILHDATGSYSEEAERILSPPSPVATSHDHTTPAPTGEEQRD
ncbi:MAG: methyltransferase domain-containing protein [Deltaproteobacteria bacterium]|nr:MAG: methyltransferase domain-containing protein [Deltaproteobacteria bacterium]